MINKNVTCRGNLINLRSFALKDHKIIRNWDNQHDNINYFPNTNFLYEIKYPSWAENKITDKNSLYLTVICSKSQKIIGLTMLENIDTINGNACWGIYIANKKYQKFNYCSEASFYIIDYAFEKLKLNKIYVNTLESNERGRKFHKKIGFKEEAVFNNQIYIDGYYTNLIWSTIDKNDWNNPFNLNLT